ncbi:MAG: efflux transporter outer membrane subunit [Nitrospira sp.]|jgi:multidrug efflux system outer membrane protein|nr:efflux transporter outer membrane subunit [Nitrospira sp.]MDH4245346.1 efflux transporter outer membrane subunit [Nitrospira sp.]MDH4356860.1 efflux transporter outer membrane subunit [Nitrospira sp.]MDH5320215.1 efflux transporter outer membrane subunit [Nitrospira sp.]
MMRSLVMAVLSLLLLSCAVGPDYKRPQTDVEDRFRMADGQSDMPSLANLAWWDLLRDEQLQQLIRIALAENRDLQRAVATVEEFRARALIARSDYLPGITVSSSMPAGRKANFLFPGFASPFNYYLLGNLAWEIDLWGRVRRLNEAARADLLSKEENRRAVTIQLVSAVAEAYFNLLQFDLQLDIAKRTLQSWEESVRIAQARLRQGMTSKLDADQFEAERANAAARTVELQRQMMQAENHLSVLLGRRPFSITRGHSLDEQVMPPEVPAGLPSELLQRRPDLLVAEQQLAAATARIGAAKAERFPKITLTGLLGVAHPELSLLFTDASSFGVASAALAAPLLNAQVLGFQQEAVEAQTKEALAQYQQAVLTAFREVEDALVAIQTARTQSEAQQQQVTALQSAMKLAELRYKGGLANYLDVLVARRSLFESELALTSTRRLLLASVVQLYKALGGGWSPDMATAEEQKG